MTSILPIGWTVKRVAWRSPKGGQAKRNRTLSALLVVATTWAGSLMSSFAGQVPVVSVSASADDGNIPANTVDGSLATRWSASGDGQWIRFDLGSATNVASVKIAWY